MRGVQGCLAHKKMLTPLGPLWDPRLGGYREGLARTVVDPVLTKIRAMRGVWLLSKDCFSFFARFGG
jgi:hypothetical protein